MNKEDFLNKMTDILEQFNKIEKEYILSNITLKVGDTIEYIYTDYSYNPPKKYYKCEEIAYIGVNKISGGIEITCSPSGKEFYTNDSKIKYQIFNKDDYSFRNSCIYWENNNENLEINHQYRLKVKLEGCTINKWYFIDRCVVNKNMRNLNPSSFLNNECVKFYIRNDADDEYVEVTKDIVSPY